MHIPAIMVLTYIACCIRIGAAPWRYFQLNARYFSDEHNIFSKLELDGLIPDRWRLAQQIDTPDHQPEQYPVFLKPEWGQNAKGIYRADDFGELTHLRSQLAARPERYLIQDAANGRHEFEIFGIDADHYDDQHDVLTITEAVNPSEPFPINSKFNNQTRYVEITDEFTADEQQTLSSFLAELGKFGISRLSVRAESREAMLAGDFHVIEINLFVPMPINLLDTKYTWGMRLRFIGRAMMALAQATKAIEPVERERAIFTLMMLYGRKKAREVRAYERRKSTPVRSSSSMRSHHG